MAGNPALATAGSGDVLTGILAALCCSLKPAIAVRMGVLLHAMAADRWCERVGSDRGLLSGEIADEIPSLFSVFRRMRA